MTKGTGAMREFGERHPTATYTIRPSAYAIIKGTDGRLAVVRTPHGLFLPGGGCLPKEAERDAVIREVMEECGMGVQVVRFGCRACELLYSPGESTYFEIPSAFLEVRVVSTGHLASEPDHVLEWWEPVTARDSMVRASQAWAIGEMVIE